MSHAKNSTLVNTYLMIRTVVMTASTIIAVSITNTATRAADKAVMIVVAWSVVAAGDNQVYKVHVNTDNCILLSMVKQNK